MRSVQNRRHQRAATGAAVGQLAGSVGQAAGVGAIFSAQCVFINHVHKVSIAQGAGIARQAAELRARVVKSVCYLILGLPRNFAGNLGLPLLESIWQSLPWLGIGLAFVTMAGLPHACNMIDGYNGLAGIVAVLVSSALVYVALLLGDRMLAGTLLALVGATLGFLYWNYPRGLIFAGDGGAYLWGALIAVASILLVQRHSIVSPWFVMLLLIYPVCETAFSICRKLVCGVSPGAADALRFHQRIYWLIVRGVVHDDVSHRMLMRNNRTLAYL